MSVAEPVRVAGSPPQAPSAGPRIDYFMVWGHGLGYVDEVLARLRVEPAFEILKIVQHDIDDLDGFVRGVYACDHVPWEHLVAKTAYLRGTPPRVVIVFARNLAPEERFFGEGPFRHIQCAVVKRIKEEIRDRFNPREHGRRTEDHVIHASDYESQTDHLLRLIGYREGLRHLLHCPSAILPAPYHLPAFERFRVREVSAPRVFCTILDGSPECCTRTLKSIRQTPHYQFLCGNERPYRAYLERFRGTWLTDDHDPQRFASLASAFRYLRPPHEDDYVLLRPGASGTFVVVDGVHRASLLEFQGVERWPAAILS